MKGQFRSEAKQLPSILAKLAGGLVAVGGLGGAVIVLTRRPDPSWGGALVWALVGVIGLAVFLAASRLLAGRMDEDDSAPTAKARAKTSALSWLILLVLAGLFLAIVLIVAV
jgi:hypothetical protein